MHAYVCMHPSVCMHANVLMHVQCPHARVRACALCSDCMHTYVCTHMHCICSVCMHGGLHRCRRRTLHLIPRSRFPVEGLAAAGRRRSVVPSLPTSAFEVIGGPRVGAVDPPCIPGSLTESAQTQQRRPVAGDKEADTRSGQRADAHVRPRAPPRGPSSEPRSRSPGLRICQVGSTRTPRPSPAAAFGKQRVNRCHPLRSPPPPKVWADCKSCSLVIVCQTGPFSGERDEGACGGARARSTLIKALFPQRSRAQMRVNPNKIGSRGNGAL